ncbi:MAG: GGDEF domain-containing protein [Rhodospirillales bacterium]|nr:GGDEF domain-containing protein [Rhodospirillales bacterium]
MAEIPVSSPISTILPADKHAKDKQRKRDQPDNEEQPSDSASSEPENVLDVFTVMDIPAEELTPKVQQTLSQIMVEFEKLREELGHARSHIQYLEELSETHTYLPVINRRGLHRELSRMLALGERAGVANTFVCFHIRNIESIRRKFGHGAAEAGLIWAAECLRANSRDTDIVGSMGGHDFGLILTLADSENATEEASAMALALDEGAYPWDGEKLSLTAAYGLHTFVVGDNAETVMERADDDLLVKERSRTDHV